MNVTGLLDDGPRWAAFRLGSVQEGANVSSVALGRHADQCRARPSPSAALAIRCSRVLKPGRRIQSPLGGGGGCYIRRLVAFEVVCLPDRNSFLDWFREAQAGKLGNRMAYSATFRHLRFGARQDGGVGMACVAVMFYLF
jgi:hypothetical protein